MGGSSSQPRMDPAMSLINAFPTPWTTKEEIALAKGWLAVSENSKDESEDSKRHKSSGSSSFNIESGKASINMITNVGDNDEDEVQEIRRPEGRDKARAPEKEEHLAFLEIKRREVECREGGGMS
ncbi:hypothetical protein Tco_1258987 [Tanacetum coccineum]